MSIFPRYLARSFASIFVSLVILLPSAIFATGTPDLRDADGDPVMLFVGNTDFGDFASFDGPESSRLKFRIGEAGEVVYFGMARSFTSSGQQLSNGNYEYRVRSAADDSIVFGPVQINSNSENLETYGQAVLGPDVLNVGGYPVDDNSTFVAPSAGEYYVEIQRGTPRRPRFIGLWDITVVKDGVPQQGRVYSTNWAFRVAELNPVLPDCAFGAELSTVFYSYTTDGFVTEIDFTDSGFQPLSFNLAFNRTGPGQSGDLIEDRRSIPGVNATDNAAEHLIFLQEPDPLLFPDGACGNVNITGNIRCQENETFCIPVSATLPGQAEIVLDFNGNGTYDAEIDRLLVYSFSDMDDLEACVPWDGLLADGSVPAMGTTVDILVEYTQGVQHWALYDGELMTNGFCVTPVRPICGTGVETPLYYDDSNIPGQPGNGAPKVVLDGCECATGNCRTWTDFQANASPNCTIVDNNTSGYGNRNTLNTWWFASTRGSTAFEVPIDLAVLVGPDKHCPDEPVVVSLNYGSDNAIQEINWTGPNGPITDANGQQNITVTESGIYNIVVVDEFGCESEGLYNLMDISCTLNVNVLGVRCDDNGTDLNHDDDIFYVRILVNGEGTEGYRYNGANRNYGEEYELGPFFIRNGDIEITAIDNETDCCRETVSVMAPPPCSNGCVITSANILPPVCSDNGTPTNPNDDQFTFVLTVEGRNVSNEWVNDRGERGPYGVAVTFGPYFIEDGPQMINFRDSADEDCALGVTVEPPMPCSNECELIPKISDVLCDDQGTPFDASDDTYTFNLSVSGINTPSVAYSVDGQGGYLYDETNSFGPYRIFSDDFTFVLADLGGRGCEMVFTFAPEDVPLTCSNDCGIEITDARVVCEDDGNGGSLNLYVEILVNSENPNSRGWRSGEVSVEGTFGEYYRVGEINPGGESRVITISDFSDPNCTDSREVTSPMIEVDCPEDAREVDQKASLQQFGGALTPESDFGPTDVEVCWLANENFASSGRRYHERFTLRRTDSTMVDPRPFSFYLYAPLEANLRGAVFSLMPEEDLDCCNLTNDGPVTSSPTNPLSMPELADSLKPSGMAIKQRFTVILRPRETYSLIVSSPDPGEIGAFEWLIVSTDQEELIIDRADGPAPQDTFLSISPTFDLLNFEVNDYLDDPASLITFGVPLIDSLCGQTDVSFSDTLVSTCVSAQIVRSFNLIAGDTTLEDVCEQVIGFRALGTVDISWPESQISLGCTDNFLQLDNGNPSPLYTGYPYVYRGGIATPLTENNQLDDLATSYEDVAITRPDGGITIERRWTITDMCRETAVTYTQQFKLQSNGAPFFTCPISNHFCPIVEEDIMLWTVGEFDCVADVLIPEPELNNICDSTDWEFLTEIFRVDGTDTTFWRTLDEDNRLLEDVPTGDYLIRFSGTHPRESIDPRYCRFRVADLNNPVAVCKTNVNLSVPGSGIITVPFSVINTGSYDNCGIVIREMRRLVESDSLPGEYVWSEWTDRLLFDCSDVGLALSAQIRVTDAAGNFNHCTSTVTVRDNTNPYCIGLDDVALSCDDLPDGFNAYDTTQLRILFGLPDVVDNCSARAIELIPFVVGDNCSPERITRRFHAIDEHGNLSTGTFLQDIEVTPSLAYAIEFPVDASTDCTDLVDTLRITGTACDSLTFRFVDIELPVEGEECRYLQRNFVVTNWCEWDGVSEPIRVGRDENCNGSEGEEATWLVRTDAGIFTDVDSLSTNNMPQAGGIGGTCDANPAGYWREISGSPGGRYVYSQRIKIFDTTAPVVEISMLDTVCVDTSFCRAAVTVGITVLDACQIDEGEVLIGIDFNNNGEVESSSAETGEFSGQFPNYSYTAELPLGEHRFVFTVTDDCGNTSITERTFRVTDCYVPFLICRGDRIYNLQPLLEEGDIDNDGIVEEAAALVEAQDLARCDFGDCSGDLTFSVNRVGEPFDREQGSLFLDCEDRYEVYLELYVWDNAFNPFAIQPDSTVGGPNWRRCVVKVFVQDPNLACNSCQVEDNITINGNITTISGAPLDAVTVSTGATTTETVTGEYGNYQLGGTVGSSYLLTAAKDADPRAGLSTIDVIILRRHLLGIQEITNPFELLAADLNRDGILDLTDVLHLQALILARESLYPDGPPWRFVDADWDGSGTPPEEITLESLGACSFNHNFIGVRMGDLNGSWGADAGAQPDLISNVGRGRPTAFEVENNSFSRGQLLNVTVKLPQGADYAGGQAAFYWNTDVLDFQERQSESLDAGSDFRDGNGYVWLSWKRALANEEVLTLRFRATADGRLSDYLRMIDRDDFADEVYTSGLDRHPLFLNWTNANVPTTDIDRLNPAILVEAESSLLGVLPNPAHATTRIGLSLAEAQTVELTVRDLNGRNVHQSRLSLAKGEQWLRVAVRDWSSGVYFYTVVTDAGTLTGKLIRQ